MVGRLPAYPACPAWSIPVAWAYPACHWACLDMSWPEGMVSACIRHVVARRHRLGWHRSTVVVRRHGLGRIYPCRGPAWTSTSAGWTSTWAVTSIIGIIDGPCCPAHVHARHAHVHAAFAVGAHVMFMYIWVHGFHFPERLCQKLATPSGVGALTGMAGSPPCPAWGPWMAWLDGRASPPGTL